MNSVLLDLLVCPLCKGALIYKQKEQELVCKVDKLAFQIVNDIPVMIEEEARLLTENET